MNTALLKLPSVCDIVLVVDELAVTVGSSVEVPVIGIFIRDVEDACSLHFCIFPVAEEVLILICMFPPFLCTMLLLKTPKTFMKK